MRTDRLIIDFNNVFYAGVFKEPYMNHNGVNITPILYFLNRIANLKASMLINDIVFCGDKDRTTTFRRKLYKAYKANRPPRDPQIEFLMETTKTFLRELGYPFLEDPLYEADDIIAMVAKFGEDKNINNIVISSDKDLYQLLNEHLSIINLYGKFMNMEIFIDKYRISPAYWVDMKMLVGDTGDNIPGIPKIGEITALKLLMKFGSLNAILDNIQRIHPKVGKIILDHVDQFELTEQLVTIKTDPSLINLTDEDLIRKKYNPQNVNSLIKDIGLHVINDVVACLKE